MDERDEKAVEDLDVPQEESAEVTGGSNGGTVGRYHLENAWPSKLSTGGKGIAVDPSDPSGNT